MNKIKEIFSGDESKAQRRASQSGASASPRASLDAKAKNDDLATRLGAGSRTGESTSAPGSRDVSSSGNPLSTSRITSSTATPHPNQLSSEKQADDHTSRLNNDTTLIGGEKSGATEGYNTSPATHTGESAVGSDSNTGLAGLSSGAAGAGLASREGHSHDNPAIQTTSNNFSSDAHPSAAYASSSEPKLERTGTGRLGKKLTGKGFGDHAHSHGHLATPDLHNFDHTKATHDHQHLQHVTHQDHHHFEVEEVLREREHDRHIHHVQHHVQPILHRVEKDETHHHNPITLTKVHETHTSSDEDRTLYHSLGSDFKDTETHRPKERTIVDLGERVTENVHHHVHHVTQPVVKQEVVNRHRIHTIIPVHHTTHEAPIIHKSSIHESVALADFLKGGGKLDSQISYDKTGLLSQGECNRSVDGIGGDIFSKLGLHDKSGIFSRHNHGSSTTGVNTGSGLTKDHSSTGLGAGAGAGAAAVAGTAATRSRSSSHSSHKREHEHEHGINDHGNLGGETGLHHNYGKFGTTADPAATAEYR